MQMLMGKNHCRFFAIDFYTAFVLYLSGLWVPSLTGIALLFGIGNAFDSVVSLFAYRHLLKKRGIDLWK